jgi:hypothetical protein
MWEIAGGIFLFIIGWILLQAVVIGFMSIFHTLNDWHYSPHHYPPPLDSPPPDRPESKR